MGEWERARSGGHRPVRTPTPAEVGHREAPPAADRIRAAAWGALSYALEALEARQLFAGAPTTDAIVLSVQKTSPPIPVGTGGFHLNAGSPDLAGWDGRTHGNPSYYFKLQESSPSWGDTVHVDLVLVNNVAGSTAGQTFKVDLYLSTDSSISTSADTRIASVPGFTVPTGGFATPYTVTLTLPQVDPVAAHSSYLGMVVDPTNLVAETNESNNSNLGSGIDLTAVSFAGPRAVATDSIAPTNDRALNLGSVVTDGTGNAAATQYVTLSNNAARSLLSVPANGLSIVGGNGQFRIGNIVSNRSSTYVNPGGTNYIAANSAETWSVPVIFDPTAVGAQSATLQVATDDPAQATISVALSGTGTPRPNLVIADSAAPSNDQTVNFGSVKNDGAGGTVATASVSLTNTGSGPLTMKQNGISLPAGPFSITGITSSTQGAISLASGAKTLAAGGAETWTVALKFDPTVDGLVQQALTIADADPNDPTNKNPLPLAAVTLIGTGQTSTRLAVADSVAPAADRSVNFGNVPADGVGKELATQTVTLTDVGLAPLTIGQNGITLASGLHYKVASIVSSTQGPINLAAAGATLAGAGAETWVVTVQFDPRTAGALPDVLQVFSNDPVVPVTTVGLNGAGVNGPALAVADSDAAPGDLAQAFPATLVAGPGNAASTATVRLTNIGTQPLVIPANGIRTLGGASYQVTGVVSLTSGPVDLAAGGQIAAGGAETWVVSVRFLPQSAGTLADTLRIASNDPARPATDVALTGLGVVPSITAATPAQTIHVSAGNVYPITWTAADATGGATVSLFYDADRNPGAGLTPIVTGLPQSRTSYKWQVPAGLVGGTYTVYARVTHGSYTSGAYAAGAIAVDAAGSDRLLSAPVAAAAKYTLSYLYNGVTRNVAYTLAMGDNALRPVVNGVTHEYHVTRVPTLVDAKTNAFDELGNVTATTDSAGGATQVTYDLLKRPTHVAYADGSYVDYTFDPAGNLMTMHDPSGWQIYAYDLRDRLAGVTYSPTSSATDPAALTIGYAYDLANRLTALTYPSGKVVLYGYSNASKLTSVTEKNAGQADLLTSYAYHPTTGLLTKTTRPNDTETVYGYDTSGRLNDIWHRRTSTQALLLRYQYTLDAGGRRTKVIVSSPDGVRAEAYVYDALSRLSQVTYSDDNGTIDPTDRVVRYGYDKNGNRLTQTTYATGVAAGATETLTYAYGFENRLLSVTDQAGVVQSRYAYDWRGNQVQKVTSSATTLYLYDARNLLTSVDDGTNHIEYQYDGAGRRVGQAVNGVGTRFVVDVSDPVYQTIEERDGAGVLAADFAFGLDRVSGTRPSANVRNYYLTDVLGSTGAVSGATGVVFKTVKYDAFGLPRVTGGADPDGPRFAGESFESLTSTLDLRNRELDVTTGSFLQKDPAGFGDGPSQYRYVANDPVNHLDPLGLQSTLDTFATNYFQMSAGAVNGATFGGFSYLSEKLLGVDIADASNPYYQAGQIGSLALGVTSLAKAGYAGVQAVSAAKSGALVLGESGSFSLLGVFSNIKGADVFKMSAAAGSELKASGLLSTQGLAGTLAWSENLAKLDGTMSSGGAILNTGSNFFRTTPSFFSLESPLLSGYSNLTSFTQADVLSGGLGFLATTSALTRPGGVLIDKAATLVGSSLKDIAGATFDPVTHQLVFLGNSNPAQVKDVNLDYFITAIQSVYGSAVPPYVTLDPPAKLLQPSFNLGDGDGVILNGKAASIGIKYTPFTPTQLDDMTLSFNVNGTPVTARIDAQVYDGTNGNGNVTAGGRKVVLLKLGAVTGLPAGYSMSQPTFSIVINGTITAGSITLVGGEGYTLTADAQGQDSNFFFTIANASGASANVTNLQLKTDLQHRKFGGRVDNTQLGWVMEEADRVMKELAIGKDQLGPSIYDSHNPALPTGFQNLLERLLAVGGSGQQGSRLWFTPNEQTLKRYIDPVTGQATVVFDKSSVKLQTENLLAGQPEDPQARAFADFFNAHYDQLAAMSFPVHDPADPTGVNVISVKIFDKLRDAMKAVALARFFHDNNIPLDTWWINAWKAPTATVPLTIPTLSNSASNGALTVTAYGGVTIKQLNAYTADPTAQIINNSIMAQRGPGTGDTPTQAWTATSSAGTFDAVAASLDPVKQDATVTLSATDLAFASPGRQPLAFGRFYDSGFLADRNMGAGWQTQRYELQFQYPTLTDDYGLMRDAGGNRLQVYGASADTEIRSGEVRLVDHATGQLLNFGSSLVTQYALDNNGNPIVATSGLGAGNVPTFGAGQYKDGSTLAQNASSKNYTLTRPDGGTLTFDFNGNLLAATDALGYALTYTYAAGRLASIADATGQTITLAYDGATGRIASVGGPAAAGNPPRRVAFVYDAGGRLKRADAQALQPDGTTYVTAASTSYAYNADGQIASVTGPDGITSLTAAADARGRTTTRQDAAGNTAGFAFAQDPTGGRSTTTTDMGSAAANDPYAHGLDALRYVAPGSSSSSRYDAGARATGTTDVMGNVTGFGYTGTSQLPGTVQLPTPGRPAITVERNAADLPTSITDPANVGGTPVQVQYNAAMLPISVTDAKGRVTNYTYTAFNAVQTVTVAFGTPLAAITTYVYNAAKLLDHVADPLGHTVAAYTYDAQGRVLTATDGDGVRTTMQYDALGRLVRRFDPALTGATNFVQYGYDDNDQTTSVTTPDGTATAAYDAVTHRLTSSTDLNQGVTRYVYDPATGRVTAVTRVDAVGGDATTRYAYDRLGRLALLTAPTGTPTSFRYDARGSQTAVVEDDGAAPAAAVGARVTGAASITVDVTASEAAEVATLTYWLDGQSASTGTTVSRRLDAAAAGATPTYGQAAFSFALTGVDAARAYRYQLTLTDRAGRSTVLPSAVLDQVPPTVVSASHGVAAPEGVTARFSEDVRASLSADALVVRNLTTGAVVDPSALAFAYDVATNAATWTFPDFAGGVLPDGNYTATLPGASVADAAGNLMAGDYALAFFHLGGDVNQDRTVDFNDLVPLAQHYNVTDGRRTWADGDFTGDGNVDFNDLVKLAQNYNTSLAVAPPAPGPSFREAWAAAFALPAPPAAQPVPAPATKPAPVNKPVIGNKPAPAARPLPAPKGASAPPRVTPSATAPTVRLTVAAKPSPAPAPERAASPVPQSPGPMPAGRAAPAGLFGTKSIKRATGIAELFV